MNQAGIQLTGLVADANVLIDYVETDRSILTLISGCLATIHVPSPVFEEVRKLTEKEAADLGIDIVEPTLSQALEAQAGEGVTSFQDRLCFVVARDANWAVLTNDTALRKACNSEGLPCVWGLEAMGVLVDAGQLRAQKAMNVAERISSANHYITNAILKRFRRRIGQ